MSSGCRYILYKHPHDRFYKVNYGLFFIYRGNLQKSLIKHKQKQKIPPQSEEISNDEYPMQCEVLDFCASGQFKKTIQKIIFIFFIFI